MNIELMFNPDELEYDIFIREGDIASGNDLATAVIISLFTWRRALPDDNIPDGFEKYGYWAEKSNDPWGSRLWLLKRSKITNDTINKATEYIQESLKWLIDEGVVGKIEVMLDRSGNNNVDGLIIIHKPMEKDPIKIKFNKLWTAISGGEHGI